jgi:hypothetical protein
LNFLLAVTSVIIGDDSAENSDPENLEVSIGISFLSFLAAEI